jgi:hypothetical protein
MIERCGDRQRKCDGLEKWPFHLFVGSLPIMLQIALLLLACGLCRHLWSINTTVACVLIVLTALGVLFYLAIVVAGTSSYACPFQTPASTALRGIWKNFRHNSTLPPRPEVLSSNVLRSLWKKVAYPVVFSILRFERIIVRMVSSLNQWVRVALGSQQHVRHLSPAVSLEAIREDSHISLEPISVLRSNDSPPHSANSSTHHTDSLDDNVDSLSQETSSPSQETSSMSQDTSSLSQEAGSLSQDSQDSPAPTPGSAELWMVREGLAEIRKAYAKDIRCVSWILRNITDPEALDITIRFACIVRWFEDGIDFEPPYNIIVSLFHTCFDSTGTLYPGSRDRACYSAQAILWIHVRAMCVAEEFASRFPLPSTRRHPSYDSDLSGLLEMYEVVRLSGTYRSRNIFVEDNSSLYMRWASHVFLHFSWAQQRRPDALDHTFADADTVGRAWDTIPLDATLDLLLVWTIYLGCPVEEELVKIQDKTYGISHFFFRIADTVVC